MATPIPVYVELDCPREIRWGERARIRLDSLPRRPNRRGYYQFAATLWAMLLDSNGFEAPEDLGDYLKTIEQVKAVGKAILAAQKQAADSEKNARGSKPRPAPASS